MKRDMDLIRAILLKIEECEECDGMGWIADMQVDDYSNDMVMYNMQLLVKAGLIEAADMRSNVGVCWYPKALTWAGHEFLDAAKEETRWKKAKGVASKVGGISFDVLKAILVKLSTDAAMGQIHP